MGKRRVILGIMILAIFMLPSTAWALEVPEVTETEYRFYLETYAKYYFDEIDLSAYTNQQLHEKLMAAVNEAEADNHGYAAILEYYLWIYENFSTADVEEWSVDELEMLAARILADEIYEDTAARLKEDYQITVNPKDYSPQQLEVLYYRTALERDYGVTEDLSEQSWYVLEDLFVWYAELNYLQETFGVTEDLSGYTLDELYTVEARLDIEQQLRTECGLTETLSQYSQEELEALYERLTAIKNLQETYGFADDLSNYTQEELELLEERLSLTQSLQEEYGVTEDLSNYTLEELEELQVELWTVANDNWWDNYAAEQRSKIEVQINGSYLNFTGAADDNWYQTPGVYCSDARPVMKDDRVYIPFRAVFEALGAEVSYDVANKTVTAKRGARIVSFVIGESSYVTNGVTIDMDGAVFVEDNRIFVPVRFASQALGVAIGWDSDNRTVVILDREKLLKGYQGQFTVLEQYLRHWDFLATQNLALQGNFNLHMQVDAGDYDDVRPNIIPLNMNVELDALTSAERVNLDAAIQLDCEQFARRIFGTDQPDPEVIQLLHQLKQFHIQYIWDLEKGRFYLKSELLDLLEGEKNAWYCIVLEDYLDTDAVQEFMKMQRIIKQEQKEQFHLDVDQCLALLIQYLPVDDADSVEEILQMLKFAHRMVGDSGLGKTADGYVHSFGEEDGYLGKIIFLTEQNAVTGLQILMDANVDEADEIGMMFHFLLEERDHVLTLEGKMNLLDYFDLVCNGTWKFTATDQEPLGKPNDGSPIYDLIKLIDDWAA